MWKVIGQAAALALPVWCAAAQQDDIVATRDIKATFIVPPTTCGVASTTDLDYGQLRRDDPCATNDDATVEASVESGTFSTTPAACVYQSGAVMGQMQVAAYHASTLTVTVDSEPTFLDHSVNNHRLTYDMEWGVSETEGGAYTLITTLTWTVTLDGQSYEEIRYFRFGGDLTVPQIDDDTKYGKYQSGEASESGVTTDPISVTVTCS